MAISEKIESAIAEFARSNFVDGHNYGADPAVGPSGRTVNARAALVAAIEADIRDARRQTISWRR